MKKYILIILILASLAFTAWLFPPFQAPSAGPLNPSGPSGLLRPQDFSGQDIVVHSISATGTAATITTGSCGTSPSVAGTWAGLITTGSNASSTCQVTFPSASFTSAPYCVAQSNSNTSTLKVVSTATTLTVSQSSSSLMISNSISYICIRS